MKAKQQTIKKFNKTVIEVLYGIPFEEAIEDEPPCHYCIATGKIHEANNPITTIASVCIDMTMDIAKYLIFKPFTKKNVK